MPITTIFINSIKLTSKTNKKLSKYFMFQLLYHGLKIVNINIIQLHINSWKTTYNKNKDWSTHWKDNLDITLEQAKSIIIIFLKSGELSSMRHNHLLSSKINNNYANL